MKNFIRIIHCADLHLDSKMTAHLSSEKARERKAELLNTFTILPSTLFKSGFGIIPPCSSEDVT